MLCSLLLWRRQSDPWIHSPTEPGIFGCDRLGKLPHKLIAGVFVALIVSVWPHTFPWKEFTHTFTHLPTTELQPHPAEFHRVSQQLLASYLSPPHAQHCHWLWLSCTDPPLPSPEREHAVTRPGRCLTRSPISHSLKTLTDNLVASFTPSSSSSPDLPPPPPSTPSTPRLC